MEPRLSWDEYAATWAKLHGGFDPRNASPLAREWLRLAYWVGGFLGRLRVPAAVVTLAGLGLSVCVPVIVAMGHPSYGPLIAAALVLLAGAADSVDGAVAVTTGTTSRLGYLYDSIADRLGEAAWLAAFWFVGVPGPLVVVAGGLSWLHEYVRARATAAGMQEIGAVTVGERPSRVSIAIVGLLLTGAGSLVWAELGAGTATLMVVVWVLVAAFGLSQLFGTVRRGLAPPHPKRQQGEPLLRAKQ